VVSTTLDYGPIVIGTSGIAQEKVRVREADPAEEYIVVQSGPATIDPFSLDRMLGGDCARQPAHVLREVAKLPAAQSALFALKSLVLSSEFEWTPRLAGDEVPEGKVAEAARAVEECELAQADLDVPLAQVAWEMMDALVERYRLAESVMREADDGSYTLKAIRPKPDWSFRYRVDAAMNVVGIDCWTGDGWQTYDPAKFTWLTWQCRDGDPRGSDSILDGAMPAVNRLTQLWPEIFQYWKEFGSPRTVVALGPNAATSVPVIGRNGDPTGKTISGELHAARAVAQTRAGATVGVPHGTEAKLLESGRDGQSLDRAITILESQVVKSIVITIQAIVEPEHASRADSDTKKSVLATFARFLQGWVCHALRRPFFEMLRANHGDAYAREFCPYLALGQVDPEVMAQLANALAALLQSGYLKEGQLPYIDDMLGLPRRRAGDKQAGPQANTPAATPVDEQATPKTAPAGGAAA
jgi:hypothetical protein